MNFEGASTLNLPLSEVWDLFMAPARLAPCFPGCESFEELGDERYRAIMKLGVGAVRGTFACKLHLENVQPRNRFRLSGDADGDSGFFRGGVSVELEAVSAGVTRVTWRADVLVGGVVASAGQRVLGGVAKLLVGQFFSCVEKQVAAVAHPSA